MKLNDAYKNNPETVRELETEITSGGS